jgi:nicotinate-nucleotide adenylyltransferase
VRTGILGGTFDPIHIAHLHAGECALRQAGLDRVLFMPAGHPWQKDGRPVSAPVHRWEMTRLAVAGVEGFAADDRELTREGSTFTADTLATFPDDEELFLILGADAAAGMSTWHRSDEVLERATVLVVPRPGTHTAEVTAAVPNAVFVDMAVLEISGTELREMARGGEPFRFLVTDSVYRYITEQRLYAEDDGDDRVVPSTEMEESS